MTTRSPKSPGSASGDARRALGTLEVAAELARNAGRKTIAIADVTEAAQHKALRYDRAGEEHYNVISAFIKSMRGSDPDAAVYWMTRMIEAGEDPLFIARRMVIFAAEDVGNADPRALQLALAVKDAVDFVGLPEGIIPLAQGVTYLASAPKSNAAYRAMIAARQDARELGALPVPLHLRNAPTPLMRGLGYGAEYQYPHDYAGGLVRSGHICRINWKARFTTLRPIAVTRRASANTSPARASCARGQARFLNPDKPLRKA